MGSESGWLRTSGGYPGCLQSKIRWEDEHDIEYTEYFPEFIRRGIQLEMLDKELADFDLARIANALQPERDRDFQSLGPQTLYDRYFLRSDGVRYELPLAFFMRVAMVMDSWGG